MSHLTLVQDLGIVLLIAGGAAWLCQRIGLSVVVGYLVAGIVIGPYTPPLSLVSSVESVHGLAELGLIFVLFFVGLELNLPRFRSLGMPVFVAALVTTTVVLGIALGLTGLLGLDRTQSLFLGGILVVSSSAIIHKVLAEMDALHEPFARTTLGITVVEDLIAVVMLAILGSLTTAHPSESPSLGLVVAKMGGFIAVVLVSALVLLPRLVALLRRTASREVQTLVLVGLLLGVAWVAARAGYSTALGAFLLGSVIGSTRHRAMVEQTFEPLRDLFAGVFFVSMGMLFDGRLLLQAWPAALGLTVLAIGARGFAGMFGMLLSGQPARPSVQVGLSLLPLGEFSFVIAQLGVASGLMDVSFYPATVGAALMTTLLAPPLMKAGPRLGRWAEAREPAFMDRWRATLERLRNAWGRRHTGRLRQLSLPHWIAWVRQSVRGPLTEREEVLPHPAVDASWGLRVHEHPLTDLSPAVGHTLEELQLRARFNCTVAGIDRQGFSISTPAGDAMLYPGDRLLVLGAEPDLDAIAEWLDTEPELPERPRLSELVSASVRIPDGFQETTLEELESSRRFGIQVLAHARGGEVSQVPARTQTLLPGDAILVLGTEAQNTAFRFWVRR